MRLQEFLGMRLAEDEAAALGWREYVQRPEREVKIKRAILAAHDPSKHALAGFGVDWCPVCITHRIDYPELWDDDRYPCQTVRLIASAWSEHPDYDEAWRPG